MNILILTNCLPEPDDNEKGVTPVVQYFATEWAVQGHNVMIIHNSSRFFLPLYYLPSFINNQLRKIFNTVIPSKSSRYSLSREVNGVKIFRFPMFRLFPGAPFLSIQYRKQTRIILHVLSSEKYVPDIITGHWLTPQLGLIDALSRNFSVKTGIVIHGELRQPIPKSTVAKLNRIDSIFFRSNTAMQIAINNYANFAHKMKVCYSGIPDSFIDIKKARNNWKDDGILKVLYVGRLITYKRVDVIIDALSIAFPKNNFQFDIIGDGVLKDSLEKKCINLGIQDHVKFHGRLPRESVIQKMYGTDCFVMVSEHETFGLVYLEAMACGAITIAAFGGGVDGIIVDRKNGYLCTEGNSTELVKILKEVDLLSIDRVQDIRIEALHTVSLLTDSLVAKRYLEDIG